MANTEKIKILIVDDLPEKLLVYETVLAELGEELVLARSGGEALRHVLQDDFAVILLDVNMPDIDGFETAELIRARKRSAHTPIIFITAHADELHAVKGYEYGAVDYILSPVVPPILRTKVRVFVDLFRKTLEVQRQAEALREAEAREHRRQLWETTERLNLALEAGRMGACEWDLGARLLSWSPDLESIFGFKPGTFSGSAEDLRARLHPDDRERVLSTMMEAATSGEEFQLEHRIIRADDKVAWVELRGKVFDANGTQPARIAGVCMDITERKMVEAELDQHRANLEQLVLERTAELERSHERLRLADRLASIGTLAAGLGHDMGNLLLPIRMRLDTLRVLQLPDEARDHLHAIETASEYLRRLSQGLRLFALDPEESGSSEDGTTIANWWPDVEPFLRNALPRGVRLESHFEHDLPAIAMPTHRFTQMVYNIVQNAGDAMRESGAGLVRVSANLVDDEHVMVQIADDGPGMTDEVRRRCMEPFFTTKTRRISTGLGLALVRGAVLNAGGTIEIDSTIGRGTTFKLVLPTQARADEQSGADHRHSVAAIEIADARMSAYVASILRAMRVEIRPGDWARHNDIDLLVTDSLAAQAQRVEDFLRDDDARQVIAIGAPSDRLGNGQIVRLEQNTTPAKLRQALTRVVRREAQEVQEV